MNRVGNQFIEQELGLLGDKNGLFGNRGFAEILYHIAQITFDRDNMLLQETCKVTGDILVNAAEGRIRRFWHRENPVHGLE